MQQQIDDFLADLRLAGRAAGTASNHAGHLLRLARWCVEYGLEWRELTRQELSAYARTYATLTPSHVGNGMCSLRTFYRWAVEQGYVAISPAAHFKTPSKSHPQPRHLTKQQVRLLLAHLAERAGRRAERDRVLVLAGLYAGLRAKELAGLMWSHIDFDAGVIAIELSKMGRGRTVPLHPELAPPLLRWRAEQGGPGDGPVFSLGRAPLRPNRVGKIVKAIGVETGLPLTAHVLRHTFATWALRGSKNVYAVSKALGHSALKQTEIYVSVEVEDIRPAVGSIPTMSGW